MKLWTSDALGNPANCVYPHEITLASAEDLRAAFSHDYVCAKYRNDRRAADAFVSSDCLPMDCDNDHSDREEDWVTPEDVRRLFPGVTMAVHYSRNHMKPKGSRSPRPRFHILFAIAPCADAAAYKALKEQVLAVCPFFDGNALDAARFMFGTAEPRAEWIPGDRTLNEALAERKTADAFAARPFPGEGIPEGQRNRTLSRFAGRLLIRCGDTPEARRAFLERAAKCEPPLPAAELRAIWVSAARFAEKVARRDGYVPPGDYAAPDLRPLKPEDFSDIGEARAFIREYGGELLYTDNTDLLRYNGVYWQESRQLALGAMMEFLDLQLEEAREEASAAKKALEEDGIFPDTVGTAGKNLEKLADTPEKQEKVRAFRLAQQYHAFVMKHREYKNEVSTLSQAVPLVLTDISKLDAEPYLLNTPEATYDIRLGLDGARPHDPKDLLTHCSAVAPGEKGRELWLDTLDRIFCGDPELIDYVQLIVGMAAVGKVFQESLIIAYGDGANGKSTFWNTVARVLGSYSGMISADALTVGCRRNVKPEMAELKGKRLIIAAELEEGMRLNTSIVKQLCSTDEIAAEKKYRDPFKYTPTHTLVLYTNHLPRVGASDDGTWRRLIVIPFCAKLRGESDIPNYTDYLVENAAPAILAWIIEGARRAIDAGFRAELPERVKEAVRVYRAGNDWMSHFLEECCESGPSLRQRSGELYQAYRAFCQRTGEYTRSTADFYSELDKAGYERKKNASGIYVCGLRLQSEFQ